MKKALLTLIISSLFITSLYADSYIKVAAFSKTENFYGSVESIEALGYDAAYIEKQGIIRVFAGPFKSSSELNSALSVIREKIAADAYPVEVSNVITIKKAKTASKTPQEVEEVKVEDAQEVVRKSLTQDSEEPVMSEEADKEMPVDTKTAEDVEVEDELTMQNENMQNTDKKYFVGISVGLSSLGLEEDTVNGSLPLGINLKKSGASYGAEGGYNINDNLFATLNYQYSSLTNIGFHDIFTSLNYKFDTKKGFSPYVGALLDYNIKEWKNHPFDTLSVSDKANQVAGGFQVGSNYSIAEDISVFALYRYIHLNYTTTITDSTNTKEIKYNHEQNFNIGLKYSF